MGIGLGGAGLGGAGVSFMFLQWVLLLDWFGWCWCERCVSPVGGAGLGGAGVSVVCLQWVVPVWVVLV